MNGVISVTYRFMPQIPYWQVYRFAERYATYPDTYQALGMQLQEAGSDLSTAPNVSIASINSYAENADPPVGTFSGPWITPKTDSGTEWYGDLWLLDDPPPPDDFDIHYWSSMCNGLAFWQMQAVSMGQQAFRFTKGHFGRPPKA